MPASTPTYGFPYPTGTDRVMDGDNAIGALALAVEQALLPTAVRLERLTDQSLPLNTATTVIYTSIRREDDPRGDLTPDLGTGLVTVNRAGWYQLTAAGAFSANVNGQRVVQIVHSVEGIIAIIRLQAPASGQAQISVATLHYSAAGATYSVQVIQDATAGLPLVGSNRSHFAIARQAP